MPRTPATPATVAPRYRISRQRAIIDRRALMTRFEGLAADCRTPRSLRVGVLATLKDALGAGRAEIRRRLEEEGVGGDGAVRAYSFLTDQIIRVAYDVITGALLPRATRTKGDALAVVAVGGYGRQEMAPFSDVDLLFLLPYKATPYSEQLVETLLYLLWDLGLKVGHATRSVEECITRARGDLTICTSLLEARWLYGDRRLFATLEQRFRAEVATPASIPGYVEAKLAERDERHRKTGDSRYLLEPNVKEGKGGLRDLHTLYWILRYVYDVDAPSALVGQGLVTEDVAHKFDKAQTFLWTVRCHLHLAAGRAEDRLNFDLQPELGTRLGYTDHAGTLGVERFMKHYFLMAKEVGDLTRILCAVLEEQHKRRPRFRLPGLGARRRPPAGYALEAGRLVLDRPDDFARDPLKLIHVFHTAQRTGLDIHPETLRRITANLDGITRRLQKDPEANRLFLDILCWPDGDPSETLHRMNEAGVFGRFVPDFGRVVAQMQFDMYHVYTVDEHTIRAIGELHAIESGQHADDLPVASRAMRHVQSRRALYVAVLLHDIAKGRGGDHSELGARVARKLGPRFGLTAEETETVSWLVLQHLAMSRTAFKRDLEDPKTLQDFMALVQSPERLRLLLVLTVVDIRAVGPNVWNGWKAGLLRDLYARTAEMLSGGHVGHGRRARIAAAQEALRDRLRDWPPEAVEALLARGYAPYWLAFDTDTHERHARFMRRADAAGQDLTVTARPDPDREATEVMVYTGDHAGLFAAIAGALALANVTIVDAKIVTLAHGMALDTFWVQEAEGTPLADPDRSDHLCTLISRVLEGRTPLRQALERKEATPSATLRRTRAMPVAARVLLDNDASNTHTVLEINARDRVGLLWDITRALTECKVQIASAHISTYGIRAVDVFYVKDLFGHKLHHPGKQEQVRAALAPVLAEDAEAAGEPLRAAPARPLPRHTAVAAVGSGLVSGPATPT